MARALPTEMVLVFRGDVMAPSICRCEYSVVDGDLSEPSEHVEDASPDFDQTVAALCTAEVTTIKTNEGI